MKDVVEEEIKIEPMREKHLSQVLAIERQSFSLPWTYGIFKQEITSNELAHYLVALWQERVAGYAGVWIILDEAHLTNIAVHPDWRRCGIGSQLLSAVIQLARARGALRMTLEVRPSNEAAQKLYKKFGFVAVGRRKKYYSDNQEDAIIMWKDL